MPDTSAFGHIKVFPFTLEKSAYLEADPDECGLPTFRFSGWASLAVPDSDGEVVDVGFFDARLSEFLANPVMRWMHGHGDVQGRYLDIKPVPGKGYWSEAIAIDFSGGVAGTEDFRRLNMLRTGAVGSQSVGFDGRYTPEFGYFDEPTKLWHWTQNGHLMEISPCDLPACPGASIQLAKSRGIVLAERPKTFVVPDLKADMLSDALAAKSDSTSLLANLAEEELEQAARDLMWDLWDALAKTLENILAYPGDKAPLFAQLGVDLGAELTRRVVGEATEGAAETPPLAGLREWAKQANETPPDATEEERVLSYLSRLSGAAEALRNFTRHASKEGGAPSPLVVETAAIPIADLVEIVAKAGAVLSTASLASVDAAIIALCALREAATGQRLPTVEADAASTTEDEEKAHEPECAPAPGQRTFRVVRATTTPEPSAPLVRTLHIRR